MRVPIRPSRPSRFPRLSIRRIIVLVALSAIVARGLQGGYRPGWHVGLPVGRGLRVGACRNDLVGRLDYGRGETGAPSYWLGAWDDGRDDRPGYLRFGLRCSAGWGVPAGRWSVHAVGPGGETVAW